MLVVNERVTIPDAELDWTFARSGGPGGQNVNKVASKAVLRWALEASTSLPEDVKLRLRARERGRLTSEGTLLVVSQRFRDQERNKEDCLEKLRQMILEALTPPVPRKATKPTRGSKRRRLADKRKRSETKQRRGGVREE